MRWNNFSLVVGLGHAAPFAIEYFGERGIIPVAGRNDFFRFRGNKTNIADVFT
jgi:hypothetical protein